MQSLTDHPMTCRWPRAKPDLLQLYSFPAPYGVKASMVLEEMELPYEAHTLRISGDQHAPEYLSFNPNNKIPAIIDPNGPDGEVIALWESGAGEYFQMASYTNTKTYLDRCLDRPAVKRCLVILATV